MWTLLPWKQIGIAAAIFLAMTGLWWGVSNHYTDVGRAEVQAKWEGEKKAIKDAETAATLKREKENVLAKEKQDRINQTITEKWNAEIAKLRNDVAIAKRVRVGTALCGQRSSGTAEADSAQSSAPADTGTIVVRDDVDRDIRALKIKVEEGFAAGRACQAFIIEQGFTAE